MQLPKTFTILVSEGNDKWVTFIDDLLSLLVGINDWGIEVIDPGISKGRLVHEKITNRLGERDWASLQVF